MVLRSELQSDWSFGLNFQFAISAHVSVLISPETGGLFTLALRLMQLFSEDKR